MKGTFEVTSLGRYEFSLAATDRGSVTVDGDGATFTSDITDTATTLKFNIIPPKTATDLIGDLGGEPGESALFLAAKPSSLQAVLAGTPLGSLGVIPLPPLTGHWHAHVKANGKMADTKAELDIGVDGRYRFRGEMRESGLWEASGGKWTRKPQDAPEESGTYKFDGPDSVTTAGITGTTVWNRVN